MKKTFLVHISGIDWDTDGENANLPSELDVDITYFISSFIGGHQVLPDDFEDLVSEYLTGMYGFCHKGFKYDVPGYTSPEGKFNVSYYWRSDIEDTTFFRFKTKEEAWEFVKSSIEKNIAGFKEDEASKAKTSIDFDLVKKHLFENGVTEPGDVIYCQCEAWWDNWAMWEEER